ncbi:11478_t:CDS:2, partial [Paraglomus brasilianum]
PLASLSLRAAIEKYEADLNQAIRACTGKKDKKELEAVEEKFKRLSLPVNAWVHARLKMSSTPGTVASVLLWAMPQIYKNALEKDKGQKIVFSDKKLKAWKTQSLLDSYKELWRGDGNASRLLEEEIQGLLKNHKYNKKVKLPDVVESMIDKFIDSCKGLRGNVNVKALHPISLPTEIVIEKVPISSMTCLWHFKLFFSAESDGESEELDKEELEESELDEEESVSSDDGEDIDEVFEKSEDEEDGEGEAAEVDGGVELLFGECSRFNANGQSIIETGKNCNVKMAITGFTKKS